MKDQKRGFERGFTLMELMVVIAIVAVVLGLIGYGVSGCVAGEAIKKDAESEARQYASEMGLKLDGVSCGDRPNSKGMVYCTIRSGSQTIPLSCIGRYKLGHGCRQTTVMAPGVMPLEQ